MSFRPDKPCCQMDGVVEKPILLVGAERSGTTLLRLMLDGHWAIAFQKEFEFAVDRVGDDGARPDVSEFVGWLQTRRNFNNTTFQIDNSLAYDELIHSFLFQKRADKQRVGATVHRHLLRLPYLFPDAHYIHIVRDPRDVALSNIGMGWAGNVCFGIDRWLDVEKEWSQLIKGLPPSRWIHVRFEDLVAQPEDILNQICAWIGVDYDPEMLEYPARSTYGPLQTGVIQRWKERLTEKETRILETKLGNLLASRGYEHSGLPPLAISGIAWHRLAFQDWLYRARFRLNRYGVRLFVADYFARRLGPRRFRNWCSRQIQKMDNANLK